MVDQTDADLVSIALARSPSINRVAIFGSAEFGPAIEVFRVEGARSKPVSVRPLDQVATVASASSDVVEAIGSRRHP